MQSKKARKKFGRERLQRIIEMCMAVEGGAVDPFLLDVDDVIGVVREFFPEWEEVDEFNLDSEVISHLASVVKLQSEWVRSRSTSLYTDPFLLEERILQAGKEELLAVFLGAWHPLVGLEQLSLHSVGEALRYWDGLLPLRERWPEFAVSEVAMGVASRDELVRERVLADRVFSEVLECFWRELKEKVKAEGTGGKLRYWDFVGADSYEETVERAFLVSFLVSYGYATLEVLRLEEEVFIEPFEEPHTMVGVRQSVSVPIAVSFDDWQKWKRGELT